MEPVSESLFHVMRTMIDYHRDPSGATQHIDVHGTYTDLAATKEAAKRCLFTEGYEQDWFETFEVKTDPERWTHGDGTLVYARAPGGEIFTVSIETAPNPLAFRGNDDHKVEGELFHVLETVIHYDIDRSGAKRDTEIQGTFRTYEAAKEMALSCLLDEDITKEDFAEYDEYHGQDDWPFDPDVVVHAVGQNGENFLVSIMRKS